MRHITLIFIVPAALGLAACNNTSAPQDQAPAATAEPGPDATASDPARTAGESPQCDAAQGARTSSAGLPQGGDMNSGQSKTEPNPNPMARDDPSGQPDTLGKKKT